MDAPGGRPLSARRVLVTGATGFIGCHAVRRLVSLGDEVHAVSSRAPDRALEGVRWHRTDLLQPGAAAALVAATRPTHVLHLAWYVTPVLWRTSAAHESWAHATAELAEATYAHGGLRFVGAGTCLEYDGRFGWCREYQTPTDPQTSYGRWKLWAQHQLENQRLRDLSSAWGRVFFVYGPGEHPNRLVPSVIRALRRGERIACSHGRQTRDLLHVSDAASGLVALLDSDVRGPLNIGSGTPVSLCEVLQKIGSLLGRPQLLVLGKRMADRADVPLAVADISWQRAMLDWRPHWELEAGLFDTIRWWQSRESADSSFL